MKISHNDLLTIEKKRHIITIQSDYPEIVYAIDRRNKVMWVINRQTGAQLEIDGDNVYKFADEMMSVADIFLKGLEKGGVAFRSGENYQHSILMANNSPVKSQNQF